jgi:hypothetical protein
MILTVWSGLLYFVQHYPELTGKKRKDE